MQPEDGLVVAMALPPAWVAFRLWWYVRHAPVMLGEYRPLPDGLWGMPDPSDIPASHAERGWSAASCWRAFLLATSVLASCGAFATNLTRGDYSAHRIQIEEDYKSDRTACDRLTGVDKDVCVRRARGKEQVAMAELAYNDSGTDADARKLAIARADADYAVAKDACERRNGVDKELCVKAANAALVRARAAAKM